MRHRVTL